MLTIIHGDALEKLRELPAESAQCCVTSPPYWGLRDYGVAGQLGLEETPAEYVDKLVAVFSEVRRVLKNDGTLWLNLGDSYAGGKQGNDSFGDPSSGLNNGGRSTKTGEKMRSSKQRKPPEGLKPKDLCGIPWRVAFALQADGWYLRSDIIWHKPSPMPESVTDRPTKAHEYLFLITKSGRYYYDAESIQEPVVREWDSNNGGNLSPKGIHKANGEMRERGGEYPICSGTRNKRSVWTVASANYSEAHFATFPPDLIKPCILAGTRSVDTVLDPFAGSGTTGAVAIEFGRSAILIELNREYIRLIEQRCSITQGFPF